MCCVGGGGGHHSPSRQIGGASEWWRRPPISATSSALVSSRPLIGRGIILLSAMVGVNNKWRPIYHCRVLIHYKRVRIIDRVRAMTSCEINIAQWSAGGRDDRSAARISFAPLRLRIVSTSLSLRKLFC